MYRRRYIDIEREGKRYINERRRNGRRQTCMSEVKRKMRWSAVSQGIPLIDSVWKFDAFIALTRFCHAKSDISDNERL